MGFVLVLSERHSFTHPRANHTFDDINILPLKLVDFERFRGLMYELTKLRRQRRAMLSDCHITGE